LYPTAENLIHIELQPILHVHKFLSFKNFVHKKIFSWHANRLPVPQWREADRREAMAVKNKMIESSFHLFKNDFLKREPITGEKHLAKKMDEFITHCHHRYFGEHYGITPAQILNGQQPDKHKFTAQIKAAAVKRREANKKFKCSSVPAC
jgi:hypothetical protein